MACFATGVGGEGGVSRKQLFPPAMDSLDKATACGAACSAALDGGGSRAVPNTNMGHTEVLDVRTSSSGEVSGSGAPGSAGTCGSANFHIARGPENVPIGARIKVWWEGDQRWYEGYVHSAFILPRNGGGGAHKGVSGIWHRVHYDDDELEVVNLGKETFELIGDSYRSDVIKKCEMCDQTELDTPIRRKGPSGVGTLCDKCGNKWYRQNRRPGYKLIEDDTHGPQTGQGIRDNPNRGQSQAQKRKIGEVIDSILDEERDRRQRDMHPRLAENYIKCLVKTRGALVEGTVDSDGSGWSETRGRDDGTALSDGDGDSEEPSCSRAVPVSKKRRLEKSSLGYFVAPTFDMLRDVKLEEFLRIDDERYIRKKWQPGIKWQETSNLLVLRRSFIQGLGVFSTVFIPAGVTVLDFSGEEIRPAVADVRERRQQERQDRVDRIVSAQRNYSAGDASSMCASMYMFRRRDDMIIDATGAGNVARFVNHSCAPNCEAKDVGYLHGKRRIVFQSKRVIMPGEELSYDYKMAPEHPKDRIPCSCGAKSCRKFMNG